jgi:hypothetical protein
VAAVFSPPASPHVYQRHRPETTALYEVVRDNLETLYGAIDDGAIAVRIPKHARKELAAYLSCGLLCRGFARLKCKDCAETHLVAFSCKGRGYAKRRNMRRRGAVAPATGSDAGALASRRRVSNFA